MPAYTLNKLKEGEIMLLSLELKDILKGTLKQDSKSKGRKYSILISTFFSLISY